MLDVIRNFRDNHAMIKSFKCKETETLFNGGHVRRFSGFSDAAHRRLFVLHEAMTLSDLMGLRSNHLEALKGDRKGQHSIRINLQWRICFVWRADGPHAVEIVDYH